jgi:hypothetical protein
MLKSSYQNWFSAAYICVVVLTNGFWDWTAAVMLSLNNLPLNTSTMQEDRLLKPVFFAFTTFIGKQYLNKMESVLYFVILQ